MEDADSSPSPISSRPVHDDQLNQDQAILQKPLLHSSLIPRSKDLRPGINEVRLAPHEQPQPAERDSELGDTHDPLLTDHERPELAQNDQLLEGKSNDVKPGELEDRSLRRSWRPATLAPVCLCTLIFATCCLIAVVQWLYLISERDHGILFAPDINQLPLRKSFVYMYLPTIISVIYSSLWAWVDLDIKRLEPYFQMSNPKCASASSTLLLSYPTDFMPTLVVSAYKHRHWSVLSTTAIMAITLCGLTPAQAGIFAVRTVTIREEVVGSYSSGHTPIDRQANRVPMQAQSVYNIAWLNESLPPFMTRRYALAKFSLDKESSVESSNATYTSETTRYSVDVSCERATLWAEAVDGTDPARPAWKWKYNTTSNCSFDATVYRSVADDPNPTKPYDAYYDGYYGMRGKSRDCGEDWSGLFFARFSKSSTAALLSHHLEFDDPSLTETSILCSPFFYQQPVNATISLETQAAISVVSTGAKIPLRSSLFNTTRFELQMISGRGSLVQTEYPFIDFPDYGPHLATLPLNLEGNFHPTVALALAVYQRPIDQYLEPEVLRASYEAAYQLMFARQMADILEPPTAESPKMTGQRSYTAQAVVVVPVFAYAATVLLFLILILAIGLMLTLRKRSITLNENPSTIGALMSLLGKDASTLEAFSALDRCTTTEIRESVQHVAFRLVNTAQVGPQLVQETNHVDEPEGSPSTANAPHSYSRIVHEQTNRGARPTEFKLPIGIVFLLIQIASFALFAALFFKADREHGLGLPSTSTFVRQLLQNYLPVAIATFMEPFWLMLNRTLCLLQPYEQLRIGHSLPARSVDLDYDSVPPQFLFWKACMSRHWIVSIVCIMVLLGNVLAVAFSSLMYEGLSMVDQPVNLTSGSVGRFRALNGTGTPFNGPQFDHIYRLLSNVTAQTPLPAWTDEHRAYLPRDIPSTAAGAMYQYKTVAFEADLQCRQLESSEYDFSLGDVKAQYRINQVDVRLTSATGDNVDCYSSVWVLSNEMQSARVHDDKFGRMAVEVATMLASNGTAENDLFCRQHFFASWTRVDWGQSEPSPGNGNRASLSRNETALLCTPKITIGPAELVVDENGRTREVLSANLSGHDLAQHFTNNQDHVVAQANQLMSVSGRYLQYHNNSDAKDFINYLIKLSTNDSSLIDAAGPAPSMEQASHYLSVMYKKLFAILIGTNINLLFEDAPEGTVVPATAITPETRILFSTPAFVIVEVILLSYVATTVLFYARRPWRILPRLPSTIASTIAFFAASHAIKELAEVPHEEAKKTRASWRWAYGTFIGTDGKSHTGIEREPFVSLLREEKLPYQPRRREQAGTAQSNEA